MSIGPSGFGPDSTTDEVLAGIDVHGKTALVTGANSGLGLETARALAARGATLILAGRDAARLAAAEALLREQTGSRQFHTAVLDLADLASVRACAADVLARFPAIHLLINNAGVMACPLARTAEGCELQFGSNHVGHFLFTCLLLPALRAAAPARVVILCSAGHKYAAVDFDDPHFAQRPYDKWLAYGQSKTANALFAVALNRRLAAHGVAANAVHPGVIVTELGRHLTHDDIVQLSSGVTASGRGCTFKSIQSGAATSVWAATSPLLEGRGGLYLEDCNIAEASALSGSEKGYLPYALDAGAAERLWTLSEQIVGQTFAV